MGGQSCWLPLLIFALLVPAAHGLKRVEEPQFTGTAMVGPSCAVDMKEPQQRKNAMQYLKMNSPPQDKTANGVFARKQVDTLNHFVLHDGKVKQECHEGELGAATEEDCEKPLVEFLNKTDLDPFCYFNFYPEVLYYWKKSWMTDDPQVYGWADARRALFAARENPNGINTDRIKLAAGVDLLGGAVCLDNGYLDASDDILYNNVKLDEVAQQHCDTLRSEFPDHAKLPLAQAAADKAEIIDSLKNGTSPPSQISRRNELYKCLIGMVGIRMQIASCKYNYCKLSDNRIGMGQQCNQDWMTTWSKPNITRLDMTDIAHMRGRYVNYTQTAQEYLEMHKTGNRPKGVQWHPEGEFPDSD